MPQNARDRYQRLQDDSTLFPESPVPGVDKGLQAQSMRDLRQLHNDVTNALERRDRQMQAWVLSNSLSRQDMALAIGISKSRVDQIIRELTQWDEAVKAKAAIERLRRHMPDDLFQEWLRRQPEIAAEFEDDDGLGGVL